MIKSHSKKLKNKKTNKLKKSKVFRKNISKMKGGMHQEGNNAGPVAGPVASIKRKSKKDQATNINNEIRENNSRIMSDPVLQEIPLLREIFERLSICDANYHSKGSVEVIKAEEYIKLFRNFILRTMVEKKLLAHKLKKLSTILNKCMNIILNSDNSNKKSGYSYFSKFTWCLLQLIKHKFFIHKKETKNYEFNFDMKFGAHFTTKQVTVVSEKFNFDELYESNDIGSFFRIYYKMMDMYNILTILSNILRKNSRNLLFYTWIPNFIVDLEDIAKPGQNIKEISEPLKILMEKITNSIHILLDQVGLVIGFFDRYETAANSKKLIPTSVFKFKEKKLRLIFSYLENKMTVDQLCSIKEYELSVKTFEELPAKASKASKASLAKASSANASSANASLAKASANSNLSKEDKPIYIEENFSETSTEILQNLNDKSSNENQTNNLSRKNTQRGPAAAAALEVPEALATPTPPTLTPPTPAAALTIKPLPLLKPTSPFQSWANEANLP